MVGGWGREEGSVNKPKSQPSLTLSWTLSLTLKLYWFKPVPVYQLDVMLLNKYVFFFIVTTMDGENPSGVGRVEL